MIAKRYRIAVAASVLVVVGWILLLFIYPDRPQEHVAIGVLLGTLLGHTAIASAWLPFGPGRLIWRLPLSIAWIASLILIFTVAVAARRRQDLDMPFVLAFCLFGQWLIMQLLLWGLSLGYGLRLSHVDDPQQSGSRQFGIRQLMIVTLIVAIVLGIGRIVVGNLGDYFVAPPVIVFSFLSIAAVVMTCPVLIAGLLPRLAIPAVLLCLTLAGVGTVWELPLLNNFAGSPGPSEMDFIAINGFTMAWVIAFLIAVRSCGYRFAGPSLPAAVKT